MLGTIRKLLSELGMSDTLQASGALDYLSQVIQAQANTLGFQDTFLVIAVVAVVAVGPSWMIGGAGRRKH
jgi:spore maturation protein SpmB